MASGKQQSGLTGQKVSPNSSNSYDECEETQWLRLPNNLELNARSKPSKKQRNKDKHRAFAEENVTKHTDGFSFPSNPASLQDLQRSKCNTATWLKDQMVNDDQSRRATACDSEEVTSDAEFPLPHRVNVNFPLTHAFPVSERSQEFQRPPSRRSMVENENTKSVKSDLKKNEAMRDEFNKLKEAVKQVEEGEREHKLLLQQMNAAFCSEEEHTNKCNHLFEKMKQSEERLMALKMQETLLYHMQKKAENKLAAFQAALNCSGHEGDSQGAEELTLGQPHGRVEGQASVNSSPLKNAEVPDQRQWITEKTIPSSEHAEMQACSWKNESQDIKQLHISLEHIRKRVQTMQQISASKNMTGSSSDDCDIADVGERVAAVEWERKKLKNKLVELQEKKKMNDKLLKELSFLKDAASNVAAGSMKHDEDSNFLAVSSNDSELQPGKEKRRKSDVSSVDTDRKLYKLQATLRHLEGMMKVISPEENNQAASLSVESTPVSVPRSGQRQARIASAKRDNVRKEQNSGFPARRHYEAEGRANEDADVPVPTPAVRPSADKWQDHPEIQEKIRKIQLAQQQVKVINDIMASIQEAKKSGTPIPVEHLRYLQSFDKEELLNDSDDASETSSEDQPKSKVLLFHDTSESTSANPNEALVRERSPRLPEEDEFMDVIRRVAIEKPAQVEFEQVIEDIESSVGNKDQLTQFQSHFHQLMGQMLQSSERKNEDHVRSSGEGGYTQNKKLPANISVVQEQVRTAPRQDNLQLTRQNIANLHAHNQNCSSNFQKRDCSSVKKDNINNLSGKMGKLSIQNTMNDSVSEGLNGSKDNLDTMPAFTSEINQNRSHSNEATVERKAILDTLKHYQKQHKMYHRHHDNQICSNSSIDSEPREGSNSALAADTTVAATWGGSSTQENFEDENDEPVESVEEQDDDETAIPEVRKKTPRCKVRAVFSDQFVNMQQYIESVSKSPQERQENFHGNQHVSHGRIQHRPSKVMKPNQKTTSTNNELSGPEGIPTSYAEEASEAHQQRPSSKFLQQLKTQIDQLNALCQRQLVHDTPQLSANFIQPPNCQNIPSACSPMPAISDITQPYNQQLLLCLSQCYHALYMQQLEIQHLHRCIRHNMEAEALHQTNTLPNQNNSEGGFRPWCPSASPLMPSNLYAVDQITPMASTYYHAPMKPYPAHNNHLYPQVSGTRPVRAVIHPTSQEGTASQETLNNQVPPRTRANNFWDNFRSYSRQNLLSTSNNMKRNENVGLPVAPQVRQVHPQVPNDCLNRAQAVSNSYCPSSQAQFNTPSVNPEVRDFIYRQKKPNSNPSVGAAANNNSADFPKKSVSSNLNSSGPKGLYRHRTHDMQQGLYTAVTPISHSLNLAQQHPVQDDSKVESFSSICPTSVADTPVSSASEPPSLPQNEYQPDFLIGLFQVAQALKSDALRQKALKIIGDLATTEINESDSSSQNKAQNDHSVASNKPELGTNAVSVQTVNIPLLEASAQPVESTDVEKPGTQTSSECSVSSTSEDVFTATVTPSSKQTASRSVSTGAVRKKPKHSSTYGRACSYSVLESEPAWENIELPLQHSVNRASSDFPTTIVENVILDLKSYLPFGLRCKDSSPAFWLAVNTCIVDSLKTRMNITLSRKSLSALRIAVDHFLSRFSGTRFSDCESDFLKYVAEFLYTSLNCFISCGQFIVTNSVCASVSSEDPSSLDADDKITELCAKVPIDADDRTHELSIKMPTEENDVFTSEFRAVLQQNVSQCNATGSDNNSNASPTSEEDMGCECGPEAEAEPEVEAGTEADLAEADQSPGQQGSVVTSVEPWPLDPGAARQVLLNSDDIGEALEESPEVSANSQLFSDTCIDQEASLDNIPTKLCPAPEEELQRQLRDEQSIHLPLSDEVRNDNEFAADNSCDSDLANKK